MLQDFKTFWFGTPEERQQRSREKLELQMANLGDEIREIEQHRDLMLQRMQAEMAAFRKQQDVVVENKRIKLQCLQVAYLCGQ